jgi:hypothetical protein
VDLVGRTVLLVDDGIGAGDVAIAAARTARHRGAARIVLAVPVAGAAALVRLRAQLDDIVCLEVAPAARWYQNAAPVGDEEVAQALAGQPTSVPEAARGAVIVASGHGTVQRTLGAMGFATFAAEADAIGAVANRVRALPAAEHLPIGVFGLGPAAEPALAAAAVTPAIGAVVAAGGHADRVTAPVAAPVLLIVGGEDRHVLALARATGHQVAVVAGASHDFAERGALEQVAHFAGAWFAQHLHPGFGAASARN